MAGGAGLALLVGRMLETTETCVIRDVGEDGSNRSEFWISKAVFTSGWGTRVMVWRE